MLAPSDYITLITSNHADKPNFLASVTKMVEGFVDTSNLTAGLTEKYHVDTAVGSQLDAVGLWVGVTRILTLPLSNVYFSWDSTAALGWDSGNWQGLYDPVTGLNQLTDDSFRAYIKAKIAADIWDGTIPGAALVWSIAFPTGQIITIKDNQDMSMTIGTSGVALTAVQQALLTGGYLPLKSAGVRVIFV